MPSTNKKSPLTYLGYTLSKCNYLRSIDSGRATKLFIIVSDVNVKENGFTELSIKVELTFKNETTCDFIYLAQFIINDLNWFKKANAEHQNLGISNLFSLVFPYVRASITAITNDSLGAIYLPVINVLDGDITRGVSFIASSR